MSQRKIIEINHALSGVHGKELLEASQKISQTRKEIIKKLERKKKLASVIQDQLYGYLEKFPQEKEGLHKQAVKKKKNRNHTFQDNSFQKTGFKCPTIEDNLQMSLMSGFSNENQVDMMFNKWFQFRDTKSSVAANEGQNILMNGIFP